jgi:hypothetical protein
LWRLVKDEYGSPFEQFAKQRAPMEITWDAEAKTMFEKLYPNLTAERPGLSGSITARGDAQVCRLALFYAVTDLSDKIKPVHLKAAMALWKYCEDSATFIWGDSFGDPVADDLLTALRNNPAGMKTTEMFEAFGRNINAFKLHKALSLLEKHGKVKKSEKRSGKAGRPIEIWKAI